MNNELLKLAYRVLEKCKSDRKYEENRTLGMGCERVAYALSTELVVKIAKHAFIGSPLEDDVDEWDERYDYSEEWQTEKELEIWDKLSDKEKTLFNPILANGEFSGFPFIISPLVEINEERFSNAIDYAEREKIDFDFELLEKISKEYELDYTDMVENTSNFGLTREGKMVITDFGLLAF